MTSEDWSTRSGLREIARSRAERISGWRAPIAYAVGYRREGEWDFPHVNQSDGTHGLPVVLLAEYLHYASGTHEFSLSPAQLGEAIALLAPAEAATDVTHPNLLAWRAVADADADEIAAVFIGSLDDESAGPADAALRSRLTRD
jgi:hypothetical protein